MKKIKITKDESEYIERLFFIYKSNEMLVKVIAKELAECPESGKAVVLDKYSNDFKNAFIELDYARRQILLNYIGTADNIRYTFDFENHEVRYDD